MLLHRKLSLICPILISNLVFLAACRQPIERLSYRGMPKEPIPQSFKIQFAEGELSSEESRAALKVKTEKVLASVGCELDSMEPIGWSDDVMSQALASTVHVKVKNCSPSKEKQDETLRAFSEEDSVASVEAESVLRSSIVENDPGKKQQDYLTAISRDAVCDSVTATGQEVVVAVIDSGVDATHPDLLPNFKLDASGKVVGANFVGKGSRSQPDEDWNDQNGHGTHVAGIIAAASNNNIGVTGVAGCANVKIMPVRVMGADGSGSSIEIDRGIQWAMAHGANVINLSLGSNVAFRNRQASHPNALFDEAVSRGVVVFAAAGNESLTLGQNSNSFVYSYPASYDHVISVAALDSNNRLASFSNRGETVDIAAPGVEILSTYMGGGYRRESGTSMASPVAAGAYALALSTSALKQKPAQITVENALTQAVGTHNLSTSDVLSSGVISTQSLAKILSGSKPAAPIVNEPSVDQPSNEESFKEEPTVQEPVPTPAPETGLSFKGIESGMQWTDAQHITVGGWPKGKTAQVRLYWVTSKNPRAFSFITMDRTNLSVDGLSVTTDKSYLLYGDGILVSEAVDTDGNTVATAQIAIKGL